MRNIFCILMVRARVEKKDPDALHFLGFKYYNGQPELRKDMGRAVKLWEEAAELGSIAALFKLGVSYEYGEGVQEDHAKAIHFYKMAAMQGHAESRYNLACCEGKKGNYDRAFRHLLISAKMGCSMSVGQIKVRFMGGIATKKQHAQALSGYQRK